MQPSKNRDTPAPSEPYAALHPTLAKLESAMAKCQHAHSEYKRWARSAGFNGKNADPTTWTARVEAARSDSAELARIRLQFIEASLKFNSDHLLQCIAWGLVMDGRGKLSDAICDAMLAMDNFAKHEQWLVPFFQLRLLLAAEIHREDVEEKNFDSPEGLGEILETSFKDLVLQFPRRGSYPSDMVAPFNEHSRHPDAAKEHRTLRIVALSEDEARNHKASARLVALVPKLEVLVETALQAEKAVRESNGHVNERQHAARLMKAVVAQTVRIGDNVEEQLEAQNKRRLDYENVRQLLTIAVKELKAEVEEGIVVLTASIAETDSFLRCHRDPKQAALALSVMINNCLAADVKVREVLRHLRSLSATLEKDLSREAGAVAVKAEYDRLVAGQYRSSADYRRGVLNGTIQTGMLDYEP
jgi:hypothetical protein